MFFLSPNRARRSTMSFQAKNRGPISKTVKGLDKTAIEKKTPSAKYMIWRRRSVMPQERKANL